MALNVWTKYLLFFPLDTNQHIHIIIWTMLRISFFLVKHERWNEIVYACICYFHLFLRLPFHSCKCKYIVTFYYFSGLTKLFTWKDVENDNKCSDACSEIITSAAQLLLVHTTIDRYMILKKNIIVEKHDGNIQQWSLASNSFSPFSHVLFRHNTSSQLSPRKQFLMLFFSFRLDTIN